MFVYLFRLTRRALLRIWYISTFSRPPVAANPGEVFSLLRRFDESRMLNVMQNLCIEPSKKP